MMAVDVLKPLPTRPIDGHKGAFGRVLVIGGNSEMIGAPAFAGESAFRIGAGLVQVATVKTILPVVLSVMPEMIGLALPAAVKKWDQAVESADAIAIGPGLGKVAQARMWLDAVLKVDKPVVVDADALNILSEKRKWPVGKDRVKARCVLTPHPGEMKRLGRLFGKTDQGSTPADRLDTALRASRHFGQIVVLKGSKTVVTDGTRYYVNRTGDSSLSKAGTGDVLTGICAALLAQGVELFDAACSATWIHGKAGELAGQKSSQRSTIARDVIGSIPDAIGEYEKWFGGGGS